MNQAFIMQTKPRIKLKAKRQSNVVALNTKKRNESLISSLEAMLEEAKSGDLTGMANVLMYHDNSIARSWFANDARFHKCIGLLHCLISEMTFAEAQTTDDNVLTEWINDEL